MQLQVYVKRRNLDKQLCVSLNKGLLTHATDDSGQCQAGF